MEIKNRVYELIKVHLNVIYKYLISIGASTHDAEDIIQDTFIKTFENFEVLANGNMRAWMFKVSINKFYGLYKKSKATVTLTDELMNNLREDFQIETIDKSVEINRVLNSMKEGQKNILLMKYYMGMSYKQIEILLDLSTGSAKTLCYRARNEFKKIWEENNIE